MPKNSTKPKASGNAEKPSYEEAVELIQQIIDEVESGEVPLEDSLERYASGMKLLKHCRGILDEAEKKIKTLTLEGEAGEQD